MCRLLDAFSSILIAQLVQPSADDWNRGGIERVKHGNVLEELAWSYGIVARSRRA